jgi:hypothetical protein
MDDIGHPDHSQDLEMIAQRIVPLLQALGTRLDAVEDRLSQCEELVTKIVTGFTGAAKDHRKTKLMDNIGQEYGERLGPVKPIYQKLVGPERDPVADIVEAVMSAREAEGYDPEGEGEFVKSIVEQIMDRFGLDSLKKLIEPAVDSAVEGGGSVEVEVTTGTPAEVTEEEDPVEAMKRALKRQPRFKV